MNRTILILAVTLIAGLCTHSVQAQSANTVSGEQALAGLASQKEEMELLVQEVVEELNESEANLKMLQEKNVEYSRKLENLSVPGVAVDEVTRSLQTQSIQLSIDLAGLEARRKFLLTANEAAEDEKQDRVLEPLQRMLRLRMENLKESEKLAATGSLSKAELNKVEIEALNAEIRFVEARQQPSNAELTRELFAVSADRAEKKARSELIQEFLTALKRDRQVILKSKEIEKEIQNQNLEIMNHREMVTVRKSRLRAIDRQMEEIKKAMADDR